MIFTAITVIYGKNVKSWTPMTPNEIAKTVHYCRKQSGLSQQKLANLAGVGKTVVFEIEKGKETVQLNTLLKVLDVLNIRMKFETPFALTMEDKP
jgi:HTH-type transcriptional regulator/antitoxin HipB